MEKKAPDNNAELLVASTDIEKMIFTIRGKQIMLDRDLAKLYGVTTGRLNEQVKRNIKRFPDDFMFQLTKEDCLRSQIAILNNKRGKHLKYFPYAFTENGIAMLSGILRSDTAIEANINIMRAFTAMRHYLASNAQVFQRLTKIEYHQIETDKRIDEVFNRLEAHQSPKQGIFYDGQIFDAYTFLCDLIRKAKKSIILIDNYVDDTVLTLLDKRDSGISAKIYTHNINQQLLLDIARHNGQYPIIEVEQFKKSHDRFLLIDEEVYHIGASLKDLGKKWFGFTLMSFISAEEILAKIAT